MNTELQTQIINELTIIVAIMTPLMVALRKLWKSKLKSYFQAKIDSIQNEDVRKAAQAAYDTVKDLIPQEITNAEVTLKPAILQAIADGKVTKDELCSLNSLVKDKVLSQLTDDAKKALETKIPDVNSYLESKVEDVLSSLKLDPESVVSKTVIPETNTTVDSTELQNTVAQLSATNDKLVADNADLKAKVDTITAALNPVATV